MKYEVEVRRAFSQWGRTSIEAVNKGQACALAHRLSSRDITAWKSPDDYLDIVAVTPSREEETADDADEHEAVSPFGLPPRIREALQELVDHYYDEEAESYASSEHQGHIFERILTLSRWLHSPEHER